MKARTLPMEFGEMECESMWEALIRPGHSAHYFTLAQPRPFQAAARQYSIINAWWLSELCRLVYRRGPDECRPDAAARTGFDATEETAPIPRDHYLRPHSLREIARFSTDNGYCVVVASDADPPFGVLVFRGTSGFNGWLANLNAIQSPWPWGGSVHSGFKAAFLPLWEQAMDTLDGLDMPLFYTGHSLGGAFAVLAASILPPASAYTFGAPRVGDSIFARLLTQVPIYRVVAGKDIVSTVPPSAIPFEFRHAGQCVLLEDGQALETEPDAAGWMERYRHLADPPAFLADHAPLGYTARLARAVMAGPNE